MLDHLSEMFVSLGAAFGDIFIIVTLLNADFVIGFYIIISVISDNYRICNFFSKKFQ